MRVDATRGVAGARPAPPQRLIFRRSPGPDLQLDLELQLELDLDLENWRLGLDLGLESPASSLNTPQRATHGGGYLYIYI